MLSLRIAFHCVSKKLSLRFLLIFCNNLQIFNIHNIRKYIRFTILIIKIKNRAMFTKDYVHVSQFLVLFSAIFCFNIYHWSNMLYFLLCLICWHCIVHLGVDTWKITEGKPEYIFFWSPDILSCRNDVMSIKVNFRPDIFQTGHY